MMKKSRQILLALLAQVSPLAFAAGGQAPLARATSEIVSPDLPPPGTPITIDVYKEPEEFGIYHQFAVIMTPQKTLKVQVVSTGRPGKDTPSGTHGVTAVMTKCTAIDGGTLDNCVFFIGGSHAMHATPKGNYKVLGQKASAGCIRQTLPDSEWLIRLVRHVGPSNVRIRVRGPGSAPPAQHIPWLSKQVEAHAFYVRSLTFR